MPQLYLPLPAPAGNGSGAAVDTSLLGAVKTLTVKGNGSVFEPSVLIEISNDPAALEWSPLVNFVIPGERTVPVVARWMRATVQNYRGGGAPVVDVAADATTATFATLVGPAGDGVGAAVDVSSLGLFKTIQVAGPYRGACNLEISNDGGVTWTAALSFPQEGTRTLPLAAQFMRIARAGVPLVEPGVPLAYIAAVDFGGGGGGGGGVAISASASLATSGTVVLSNSNGISFGLSDNTVSARVASVSATGAEAARVIAYGTAGWVDIEADNFIGVSVTGTSANGQFRAKANNVYITGSRSVGIYGDVSSGNIEIYASRVGVYGATSNGRVDAYANTVLASGVKYAGLYAGSTAEVVAPYNVIGGAASQHLIFFNNAAAASSTAATRRSNVSDLPSLLGALNAYSLVGTAPGGAMPIALSAGTSVANSGTVVFSNANNVSFGLSNGTLTASAPSPGGPGAIIAINPNGGVNFQTGTVWFSTPPARMGDDTANVSFTGAGFNSIWARAWVPGAISAGTASMKTGTLVFSDANNVSFGLNGQTLTASFAAAAGGVALAGGTQTATSGTIAFSNSNGVEFGLNGSRMTAGVQSVIGTGAISAVVSGSAVRVIGGFGLTASGNSNINIIASRGLSMDGANVNVATVSSHSLAFFQAGAGATKQTGISDGPGILAALDAYGLFASSAGGAFAGVALVGGTQTQATGTVIFSNANNISFGLSNGTMTASVAAGAGVAVAGGGQTATAGTVVFSNSNGISFGLAGSSRMTALVGSVSMPGAFQSAQVIGDYVNIKATNHVFISGDTPTVSGNNVGIKATGTVTIAAGSQAFGPGGFVSIAGNTGTIMVGEVNDQLGFFGGSGTVRQTISDLSGLFVALDAYHLISSNGYAPPGGAAQMSLFESPYNTTKSQNVLVGGGGIVGDAFCNAITIPNSLVATRCDLDLWASVAAGGSTFTIDMRSVTFTPWSVTPGEYVLAHWLSYSTGGAAGNAQMGLTRVDAIYGLNGSTATIMSSGSQTYSASFTNVFGGGFSYGQGVNSHFLISGLAQESFLNDYWLGGALAITASSVPVRTSFEVSEIVYRNVRPYQRLAGSI